MKLLLLILLVLSGFAQADERLRPQKPSQLEDASKQKAVKVNGARVSYANFDALRRDFPGLRNLSNEKIAQWVLDNFAYISEEQLKLNGIRQSDIPADPKQTKDNFRPEFYGRAGVMEGHLNGQPIGMVDVKGLGLSAGAGDGQVSTFKAAHGDPKRIDKLRAWDHSDGLMRHGEAIAELSRQTAAQRLFDLHNHQNKTDYQTVESYFVIEMPFDVLGPDGRRDRAALYGRQAHWRGDGMVATPEGMLDDPRGGKQGSIFRSLVDFGGTLIQDPRLRQAFGARDGGSPNDPQDANPWRYGHEAGEAFRNGDTFVVYRHLEQMLSAIDADWKKLPKNAAPQGTSLQKTMLDMLDAAAGKPGAKTTDALLYAMHRHWPNKDYFFTRLITSAHLDTVRDAFSDPEDLRGLPRRAITRVLAGRGENDPLVKAMLAGLGKAIQSPRATAEQRLIAIGFLRDAVQQAIPPERQAAVLAPHLAIMEPVETEYVRNWRERLGKAQSVREHAEILIEGIRSGEPLPDLAQLVEKDLKTRGVGEDRFYGLAPICEALWEERAGPATDDLVAKLYAQYDVYTRKRIAKYYAQRKAPQPPPEIAAAIRGNALDERGREIEPEILKHLLALNDPATKDWVLAQLDSPKLSWRSWDSLWDAAVRLQASQDELMPRALRMLKSGRASLYLGREAGVYLLTTNKPEGEAAVREWLRRIGPFDRKSINNNGMVNDWIREQAGLMGTSIRCADVWIAARQYPVRTIVGGTLAVGTAGYLLFGTGKKDEPPPKSPDAPVSESPSPKSPAPR